MTVPVLLSTLIKGACPILNRTQACHAIERPSDPNSVRDRPDHRARHDAPHAGRPECGHVTARSRLRADLPLPDEAKYARTTIESVLKQTERPALWVIVDDGSKDHTGSILREYAEKYPWIRVVNRKDRGERVLGSGVMEAFYSGFDSIDATKFDFICKLDLDLDLPEQYFAALMDKMESEPRLGACSGKPYFVQDGRVISEKCGDEHAVGMTKFYRTACFTQIGGFVRELMWDGIDTHRCRMLGWKAASWDGEIASIHPPASDGHEPQELGHRPHPAWSRAILHGHQPAVHAGQRAPTAFSIRPFIVGCLAMLWGYFQSLDGVAQKAICRSGVPPLPACLPAGMPVQGQA